MIGTLFQKLGMTRVLIAVIVMLLGLVTLLGDRLDKSYKDNGKLSHEVEQWKIANDITMGEYQRLDAALAKREQDRNRDSVETRETITQLKGFTDETDCLDAAMPADLRLLFIKDF